MLYLYLGDGTNWVHVIWTVKQNVDRLCLGQVDLRGNRTFCSITVLLLRTKKSTVYLQFFFFFIIMQLYYLKTVKEKQICIAEILKCWNDLHHFENTIIFSIAQSMWHSSLFTLLSKYIIIILAIGNCLLRTKSKKYIRKTKQIRRPLGLGLVMKIHIAILHMH